MMVTESRNVIRLLGSPGNDIPKAILSSVKCSKKSRRSKKRTETQDSGINTDRVTAALPPSQCLTNQDDVQMSPVSGNLNLSNGYVFPNNLYGHYQSPYSFCQEKLYGILSQERHIYVDNRHLFSVDSAQDDKIDSTLRTETLSNLWFLHGAYYSLSSSTFCKAVCLMDSFVAKVKVKPKYAMCVGAACYYIASRVTFSEDCVAPTPENLVTLSRCGGTADDLTRMVRIVLTKLTATFVTTVSKCTGTAFDFLRFFLSSLSKSVYPEELRPDWTSQSSSFLFRQLEAALVSTEASCYRPSCIALALLSLYSLSTSVIDRTDHQSSPDLVEVTNADVFNLSQLCGIPWPLIDACASAIRAALNVSCKSYSIQDFPTSPLLGSSPPLVWTLSRRTQRSISTSSPPALNTIVEEEEQAEANGPLAGTLLKMNLESVAEISNSTTI